MKALRKALGLVAVELLIDFFDWNNTHTCEPASHHLRGDVQPEHTRDRKLPDHTANIVEIRLFGWFE